MISVTLPLLIIGSPLRCDELLNKKEQQVLIKIARDTLNLNLNKRLMPELAQYPLTANVRKQCGVFVTLKNKKDGELRGCIGYIYGVKPLCESVRDCTVEAATHDMRFTPMQKGEDQSVTIEISVLSPPAQIYSIDRIEVGTHGLIISKGMHRGVLLPQVPTEWGWNRDDYLKAICRKAGLPDDGWRDGADLYTFTAQVFKEELL
jgi:AmmeMemoRadiSam system protein A